MRSDWTALPAAAVAEVESRTGEILHVTPAPGGDHAEIASTVIGKTGTVFVKAAPAEELSGRSLRYELNATRAVGRHPFPPAILWSFDAGGWLVGGFQHLAGPHPDLSPGSPDLDLFAVTLKALQETPAPDGTWFSPQSRLGVSDPAAAGEMLVHSDLNTANLIITDDGLRIVDWAFATRAAPWVELALLAQWLIGSGHTPAAAEAWLAQFPAWSTVDRTVLNDFALHGAARWSAKAQQSTARWVHDLAAWNGKWAAYRRE